MMAEFKFILRNQLARIFSTNPVLFEQNVTKVHILYGIYIF